MYLTLVLFNALVTAAYLVLCSKVMKESGLSPNATIAAVHLPAAALLAIPAFLQPHGRFAVSGAVLSWLAITSGLKLLSKELAFFGYANTDVADVTVWSAFIPIFGLLFGVVMLNERVAPVELLGTLIVCVSVYLLFPKRDAARGPLGFLSPFFALGRGPVLAAVLSVVPIALASVYMKKSALVMGELPFSFVSTLLIGLGAAVIESPRPAAYRGVPTLGLLGIAALFALAQASWVALMTHERVAHTVAFQPLGIVFQMALAYAFLGERDTPVKRLACGTGIVAGSALLHLGGR